MATTPILGITQVTTSQNSKEVTINDAIIALEAATNAKLEVDYTASTSILLSNTQATRNFLFVATNGTADSILRLPNVVNSNNLNRLFAVRNESGHQLTVKFNTGAGSTVIIPDGATRLLDAMDGNDIIVAAEPATVVTFLDLTDTPATYAGQAGRFLTANLAENALEFTDAAVFPDFTGNEGKYLVVNATEDGVEWADLAVVAAFTDLTDTPSSYTGQNGKLVAVNSGGTALEFIDMPDIEAVEYVTATRWRIRISEPGEFDEVGFGEIEWLDVDGINVATGGTASASSFQVGKEAEFAFDGNTDPGEGWISELLFAGEEWIEYEFASGVQPRNVNIYPINGFPGYSPARIHIERFDGTDWIEAGERTPAPWVSEEPQLFKVNGVPFSSVVEAPIDGTPYVRQDADWVPLPESDAFPDLTGNAGKFLAVNITEDGVEWLVVESGVGLSEVVTVSAADSNLLASQVTQYLRFTEDAAKTLTVQPNATEAMPADAEWNFYNEGDADLTIIADVGVTINVPATGSLVIPKNGVAALKRVAEDVYDLVGQTKPSDTTGLGVAIVTATGTGASQVVTLPSLGLNDAQVLVFVNGIRYESDEYSISEDELTLTTNAAGDSIEIACLSFALTETPLNALSEVKEISGTTYNLLAADAGKYLRATNAGTKTFTVQDDADEAQPAHGEWHIRNAGAGDLTLVEDTAVTINVPFGGTLVLSQGMSATLKRVATDEYDLLGQTVAA
jgi:hypothetical protein